MSGSHKGDSRKVVIAALLGNFGITVAKFIAAHISGSTTMLAEAVHSVADTGNQGLLLLGLTLAKRVDPVRYPLGRHKESYFWSFIVALLLFFLGGVFAVYEGIHKITASESETGSPVWALAVLGVSIALEGTSFLVALREFNKTRGGRTIAQALFRGKDPTIPVVLLEDSAAVVGLTLAILSIGASAVWKSPVVDGVGSILIGAVLCTVGALLAYDTRSLLLGEGMTPEMRAAVMAVAPTVPGVVGVRQLLSMHLGPESVLLALKVAFDPGLCLSGLEQTINDLEVAIRKRVPEAERVFIEPDSRYDETRDPTRSLPAAPAP